MYLINEENTTLDSYEKVCKMATLLNERGYEVDATRDSGLVNPFASFPDNKKANDDWFECLLIADEDAGE